MVSYNVRFTLKRDVDEAVGVAVVRDFLSELSRLGEVANVRIEREVLEANDARFLAFIEFADADALARAMKNQEVRGIHQGHHGNVVRVVHSFQVEIVHPVALAYGIEQYACEI